MSRNFVRTSNQYLSNTSAVPVSSAPLTFACWFKATTASLANNSSLMSISDGGASDNSWFLLSLRGDVASDPIEASCRGGAQGDARTSASVSAGAWAHACAVFASSTSRTVYVNGGSSGSNTTSATPSGLVATTIGRRTNGGGTTYYDGDIAHVCIWNVALSATEVAQLANRIHPYDIKPRAIVGYWALGGTASPEPDWSGGKRNMTLNGGPTSSNAPPVGRWWGKSSDSSLYTLTVTPPVVVASVEPPPPLLRMRSGFGR